MPLFCCGHHRAAAPIIEWLADCTNIQYAGPAVHGACWSAFMQTLLVVADCLEDLDPFDAAFVEAVLHIQGIDEIPTRVQQHAALQLLNDYIGALSRVPHSDDPVDVEWLDGHTLDSAASQFAF